MPNDNKISATISAQDKADILAAFDTIRAKLPFLVNLTPAERRRTPTLGTERGAMDQSFATEMASHPELVPGYVDTAEMAIDRALWVDLAEIASHAREVCEGIEDTTQVAGSDIYMAYLSFYQAVRQAARRNVPGADALYQNLRQFFPSGNGGGGETPPANP
ncbi:MAG: hypothetical protein KDL87_10515 [Verrucomicrobiae bacterium]|nr:hypothetical protein [Verrucomicrobiae bacterium]